MAESLVFAIVKKGGRSFACFKCDRKRTLGAFEVEYLLGSSLALGGNSPTVVDNDDVTWRRYSMNRKFFFLYFFTSFFSRSIDV